jgi:hypothetical protein
MLFCLPLTQGELQEPAADLVLCFDVGFEPVCRAFGMRWVRMAIKLIWLKMQAIHHGSGFTGNDIAWAILLTLCPP